ncbi:transglutaminase-like cysteine peptidase [Bradyrhizobium sp. NP1]|uniref:transglutaminase-like cysteine peptidase n=1 Tax=Bradyrhizobium sp. NP1 TaxID=3049772 RepID=UPI0025A5A703|nr:transglutaminase-like cysteine peptidase [Bradyrhizobium sp. NP1]WJR81395.1 transglutaminase-like cysteine peptidase [Bradyrhizobium sp. NP1]
MTRTASAILAFAALAGGLFADEAHARNRHSQDIGPSSPIAESAPTLAPFQHVRFCLRYPSECKSDPMENERIDMNAENSELLDRINRGVNASIIPMAKSYGTELQDGWTISPSMGDCNDFAVTKRHELLQSGLPARALRLSVVTTASGVGHLVLVVATTKGDLVLDNLTETIRTWQQTDYHWLKIQSTSDARFWYEIRTPGVAVSQADRKIRLAYRRIN